MTLIPRNVPRTLYTAPVPTTVSPSAQGMLRQAVEPVPPTLEAQREVCNRVQRELGARQLQRYAVQMRESTLAGIPVRIFTPQHPSSAEGERVLLNLHGGGFTKDAGSITENVPVAALTGIQVVAVRYRLAPEFPFPAAVDDAVAVYRVLLEQYPHGRIGLYGTSAGAILCTQLLVRLQRERLPLPRVLGFFSGTADLSRAGDSEHFFRLPEDESTAGGFFSSYIGTLAPTLPELSAAFAELREFPPTLCIAGTRDFLLSQTALFHRALLRAGVAAQLVVFEAMPHAHWIYLDLPESDEAFAHMAQFLARGV
ncbi:MAG TPA: alpha/beta hydrolase [Steroidobacteraceae bacterium]|nr:alpha/beta hydrolase [Steroidobacteraceae bacterium]